MIDIDGHLTEPIIPHLLLLLPLVKAPPVGPLLPLLPPALLLLLAFLPMPNILPIPHLLLTHLTPQQQRPEQCPICLMDRLVGLKEGVLAQRTHFLFQVADLVGAVEGLTLGAFAGLDGQAQADVAGYHLGQLFGEGGR